MAKKKIVKKAAKKVEVKTTPICSTKKDSNCKGILALAIIVLTWWKPAETWSQIIITVAAAIILLSAHGCCSKK
jgi:hypothetical protein